MSTKSTIFLTRDNEHCYEEGIEWTDKGPVVYMELDKQNVEVFEDKGNYFVKIKPGSHLYNIVMQLKYVDEDDL